MTNDKTKEPINAHILAGSETPQQLTPALIVSYLSPYAPQGPETSSKSLSSTVRAI